MKKIVFSVFPMLFSYKNILLLRKSLFDRASHTINLAASNHTSSDLGHSSHPFMIRFLAACNLPVTSSRRAEAIHAENNHILC